MIPSRSQILDALKNADFNPLACRVSRAVADYELARPSALTRHQREDALKARFRASREIVLSDTLNRRARPACVAVSAA